MSNSKWLLYGVGETGTLIAEEAVRRGHAPLLAGRSAEKLRPLAERLGLEWVVVDLMDAAALAQTVAQVEVVVHAAGPFMTTSAPMVQACLAQRRHYLDISNEIPVFQAMRAHDAEARRQGVALISGVGFGAAATDGLAHHVAAQVAEAKELEIATYLYTKGSSAGASKTRLEVLGRGGWLRREGQLVPTPLGQGAKKLSFPFGAQTIIPVPTGDLEAAFYNTAIPNITVYSAVAMPPFLARLALPLVQRLVANPTIKRFMARRAARSSPTKDNAPAITRSYIWARAVNQQGQAAEAWQEMGEGYAFTASSTVRAVEEVFTRQPLGALTPAQAFGADFALSIAGVTRYEATKG